MGLAGRFPRRALAMLGESVVLETSPGYVLLANIAQKAADQPFGLFLSGYRDGKPVPSFESPGDLPPW